MSEVNQRALLDHFSIRRFNCLTKVDIGSSLSSAPPDFLSRTPMPAAVSWTARPSSDDPVSSCTNVAFVLPLKDDQCYTRWKIGGPMGACPVETQRHFAQCSPLENVHHSNHPFPLQPAQCWLPTNYLVNMHLATLAASPKPTISTIQKALGTLIPAGFPPSHSPPWPGLLTLYLKHKQHIQVLLILGPEQDFKGLVSRSGKLYWKFNKHTLGVCS